MIRDIRFIARFFFFILMLLFAERSAAQVQPYYNNSWIIYEQPYVKVTVSKKGLQRILFSALPAPFSAADPDKIQLWHRGKQVAILGVDNKEILFYGLTNDGASDSLLYRPMSARINPYFSMYGDAGAYFLTIGKFAGERAKSVSQAIDPKIPLLGYHRELVVKTFTEEYSLGTEIAVKPEFINSFFELGASRTGYKQSRDSLPLTKTFQLKNKVNSTEKFMLKLLLHGRSGNQRTMEFYIGPTAQKLRLAGSLKTYGFSPDEYAFEIKPEDVDAENKGVLQIKSVSDDRINRYSLTYFTTEFSQSFDTEGLHYKEFNIKASKSPNRISIRNTNAKSIFLDIANPDKPVMIKGAGDNLMVPGQAAGRQVIVVADEIHNAKTKETSFKHYDPKTSDYIIITTKTLWEGAQQYAAYRASPEGGQHKTLVADIEDVYDQFNYGEPSPLAIRNFMEMMLGQGVENKYLFLIGKSITYNLKMQRELPDEVPTVGYPASDVLLVDGLAGAPVNYPACPVGRFSGLTNQQVLDYLDKVKEYESQDDIAWRKRILHLNGGKSAGEIGQFKSMLEALKPAVSEGALGGEVKAYAKQKAMGEAESVNITADVNEGVGMITFFGHGSASVTDLDFGYATDVPRAYNNPGKYPVMYFNGCGVGNVFTGRFNPKPANPKSLDRMPLSLDWLLVPKGGAIAIIANSYESMVSTAATYMDVLYKYMFRDEQTAGQPIGKIQQLVAKQILANNSDHYNIGNVHQSLLQGDPALKLITAQKPDYALDPDESIALYANGADKTFAASDSVLVKVSISNNGRFVKTQQVALKVTAFRLDGKVVQEIAMPAFPLKDTMEVSFFAPKNIQKIQVEIDPDRKISELNEANNIAEMDLNWDLIKDKTSFSYEKLTDNISPVLTVTVNGKLAKNGEIVKEYPVFNFKLTDDRQLFPDDALFEIFLKPCGNDDCEFVKMILNGQNHQLEQTDPKTITLQYPTALKAGTYEMLVNVRDRAGNVAAQPYRIRFVVENEIPVELTVSPNPASDFVHFELRSPPHDEITSIKYRIIAANGLVVKEQTLPYKQNELVLEWYWLASQALPGAYTYQVIMQNAARGPVKKFSGKIVLLK